MLLPNTTNLAVARQQSAIERERQIAEKALATIKKEQSFRERMTPLPIRVRKFAATIPAAVQLQGVPMAVFVDNLAGKYRGHANPGDIGRALRSMGWIRIRKWRSEHDGFTALWYPPVSEQQKSPKPSGAGSRI